MNVNKQSPLIRDGLIKVVAEFNSINAVLLDNFLAPYECDELIDMAFPNLKQSTVVDDATGLERADEIRTSSGAYLYRGDSILLEVIEDRIEQLFGETELEPEPIHVLRYNVGDYYKPHFDWYKKPPPAGQRVATLLFYLNDVTYGGETCFPSSGIKITPKKGSALFFYYPQQDGSSLHSSLSVEQGEKFVATRWFRRP